MREIVTNGTYRHYKGKMYKVVCVAKHSETEEDVVVYQCLYGDYSFWVRPKLMFLETVNIDGQEIERFAFCEES